MTDVTRRTRWWESTILALMGAVFAVSAPLFGLTYAQPDMGLLVIIVTVPLLWFASLIFGILAIIFAVARWQRITGLAIVSMLGLELLAVAIPILVNVFTP